MELKQLQWFVRVAELGSLTRASVELDVAQPALSRQIRNLETELGQRLLIRTGRGVRVTEAGRVMLDHGRGILHQVSRLREELGRLQRGLVGRVAVGMPPSLSRALAVPLTREFRRTLPEAGLTLTEGLSQGMLESVVNGDLDLALVFNPTPSPELDLTPLARYPLYVVRGAQGTSGGRSITLPRVAELPLIIPSRPNAVRMELENRLAALGRRPNVDIEVDTIPGILDLVREGFGAAILPRISVSAFGDGDAFRLQKITRPEMAVTLYRAQSARRPVTGVQRNVVALVESLLDRA